MEGVWVEKWSDVRRVGVDNKERSEAERIIVYAEVRGETERLRVEASHICAAAGR